MLRTAKILNFYTIDASDGSLDAVSDVLFDDQNFQHQYHAARAGDRQAGQ
jgi:hypothetical protein